MNYRLMVVGLAFCGVVQAQTWQQFLGSNPWFPNELAPSHGLALDGAGGVFVQALNTREYGTEFSHIYYLSPNGQHASMWSLIGRPGWTDTAFISRGFSARDGYRVAWFETGQPGALQDVVHLFDRYGGSQELHFPRSADEQVLRIASDGNGGVLIVRTLAAEPGTPQLQRHAWGSLLWSQPLRECWGMEDQPVALLDLDNSQTGSATVLAHCAGNNPFHANYFTQRIDVASGMVQTSNRFYPGSPDTTITHWHGLGQGHWLLQREFPGGFSDLAWDNSYYPVPMPWPGMYRFSDADAAPSGALISLREEFLGSLVVNSIGRQDGESGWVRYPDLDALADRDLHWAANSQDRRVVAYRQDPLGVPTQVVLTSYAADDSVAWTRLIANVTANAQPQLRGGAANDEFVLAVDQVAADGTIGVHVEQFAAD